MTYYEEAFTAAGKAQRQHASNMEMSYLGHWEQPMGSRALMITDLDFQNTEVQIPPTVAFATFGGICRYELVGTTGRLLNFFGAASKSGMPRYCDSPSETDL